MPTGSGSGFRNDSLAMSIWRGKDPLILASQSHARKMLLANAGIPYEAVPADIDERAVQRDSGLAAPGEIANLLAREKARLVSSQMPGRFVVGADQTLALGNRLFSKPAIEVGVVVLLLLLQRRQLVGQVLVLASKRSDLLIQLVETIRLIEDRALSGGQLASQAVRFRAQIEHCFTRFVVVKQRRVRRTADHGRT